MLVALLSLVAPTGATRAAIDTQHLGAKYDDTRSNITFRVYSSRATRIELDLLRGQLRCPGGREVRPDQGCRRRMVRYGPGLRPAGRGHRRGGVLWLPRLGAQLARTVRSWTKGSSAGFIADVDASGNRFNPNKLLFDPYALELSHDPINPSNSDATVFASGANNRTLDSGPKAPKGIVLAIDTSSIGTKPTRAQKDDIIYEVHVRGLTENDPRHTGGSIAAPIRAPRSRRATSRAWASRRSNFFRCRRPRTTRMT